jgi:alcohol dehydrogenase class IV
LGNAAVNAGTPFEFATATKIVFGRGAIADLPRLVSALGDRALVVVGKAPGRHAETLVGLEAAGLAVSVFSVEREPSVAIVERGLGVARAHAANVVVGLGGGSVIDAGKAIGALLGNPGEALDYLEVIGRGRALLRPSLPFVAVPTTSGTGAEVTKNAVLESPEHGVKVSLRSESMLPRVALVDPLLTLSLPPGVTAAAGLDALTQLVEPYLCSRSNPLVDAIAFAGIRHVRKGLRRAYADGNDVEAREHMSLASLFGGLALANAKLGAVHGIAGPLGGMTGAPHGALCARLLPEVTRCNVEALRRRAPSHPALVRLQDIAALLTGNPTASVEDVIEWFEVLVNDLGVQRLEALGFQRDSIAELVGKAQRASSMQGNPIPLLDEEVAAILEACL